MRVKYDVEMNLLSDAIFGSGSSIPGGEDIAVYQDEKGYPYFKGSSLKGLLKESLENLLVWTGGEEDTLKAIMGTEGKVTEDETRRLQLTSLMLKDPPQDAADCYDARTFTSLENGIIKEGTLREAACIRSGLKFLGSFSCAEEDAALLKQAFQGIKWAGTLRSRGFGRVSFTLEEQAKKKEKAPLPQTNCIYYCLKTELPVQITDLSRSSGANYETRGYITGSAVRGMVIGELLKKDPAWFEENKNSLLQKVRFLDAVPNPTKAPESTYFPAIPSVMGFYEDKEETKFVTVLKDGEFEAGLKRAKLGSYCAPKEKIMHFWSAETASATRIKKEDKEMFATRYLESGQFFEGCILLEDAALAPMIGSVFAEEVWLGADRFEGFGKCSVTELEATEAPKWLDAYGYKEGTQPEKDVYLTAVSPFTMLDAYGEPCGLDTEYLAKALEVERVEVKYCSTSVSQYSGFNRKWGCYESTVRMYDRGSTFHLLCEPAPKAEALRALQKKGLGIRKEEGFGQILFLRTECVEGLAEKEKAEQKKQQTDHAAAELRRAKYNWISEKVGAVKRSGLSKSQIGSVQSLCEKAISKNGNLQELEDFMQKNLEERGAAHGAKFKKMEELLDEVLEGTLSALLGVPCRDSVSERLRLLCMLFDHSRKEAN